MVYNFMLNFDETKLQIYKLFLRHTADIYKKRGDLAVASIYITKRDYSCVASWNVFDLTGLEYEPSAA